MLSSTVKKLDVFTIDGVAESDNTAADKVEKGRESLYVGDVMRPGLTHYRPAMPFGNRKNILEDVFSSVLSQF